VNGTSAIRVLICDDQAIVCEGLRAILESDARISVTGIARDGQDALDQVRRAAPDVVLMDLKMPRLNGVQATRQLRTEFPGVRVLVLTTFDADEWVLDAVRAGAAGYLLKDAPQEHLVRAIIDTFEGRNPIDPQVAGTLMQRAAAPEPAPVDRSRVEQLTERERDVLRLLAQGRTNTEIAGALFLSEGTVKNYVSSLFSKLGVDDRTQAAVFAIRAGMGKA
jgi:DNA-binding NarL/FixJ family response regulator